MGDTDFSFVFDALGGLLAVGGSDCKDPRLAGVCDVAALWLLRRQGRPGGDDAARSIVGIIPMLLKRMAERREDLVTMQYGCRLLYTLARGCGHWPADVREPALAALAQLREEFHCSPSIEVRSFGALATQAVTALPTQAPVCLSAMD